MFLDLETLNDSRLRMPYNHKIAGQQSYRLDSCSSTLFLNLLIFLLHSDNNIGGWDVSRDVLYEPEGKDDLIRAVFSRYFSSILRALKKVFHAINV